MEIIIEEITRGHKLIARHKFAQDSILIGRGYHNDVIISDPHVCAEHLEINFDGQQWLLTDKDTVNGSFFDGSKNTVSQNVVQSGEVITIGKSALRIIFPDHPVEESVSFSPFENLIDLTRHPLFLIISIALFTAVTGWLFNLHNPQEVNFTQLLVPAVGVTLMFSMWPIGISFVAHLAKHEARFWGQLGICFLFFNLMWLSDFIENIISFNSSGSSLLTNLVVLLPIALAFCLFWLNCYIGFHMSDKRKIVVALCLTSLLFGGSFLVKLSKQADFSIRPHFNTTLMTPNYLFVRSNNVESFIEDSKVLFAKAQKAAQDDDE